MKKSELKSIIKECINEWTTREDKIEGKIVNYSTNGEKFDVDISEFEEYLVKANRLKKNQKIHHLEVTKPSRITVVVDDIIKKI